MTAPPDPRRRELRRSRADAVLGGVCAGVARSAGLDPLLLRIAVVAATMLTAGAGLVAYLAAWVLLPREAAAAADPATGSADDPAPGTDPTPSPPGGIPAPRRPPAADDAATAGDDRLREPT